jgi:hypothetical protein
LAYESIQALRKVVIGTTGDILLYVGVGLFVLAAVLMVVDLFSSGEHTTDAVPTASTPTTSAPEPQPPTDA